MYQRLSFFVCVCVRYVSPLVPMIHGDDRNGLQINQGANGTRRLQELT